jgi:hypothetical protein
VIASAAQAAQAASRGDEILVVGWDELSKMTSSLQRPEGPCWAEYMIGHSPRVRCLRISDRRFEGKHACNETKSTPQ